MKEKKYFLQFAHNSKEKKDHDGAQIGGFFVGKEIPDSDSSEEGDEHRNDQWAISAVQKVKKLSETHCSYSCQIMYDWQSIGR